MAITITSIGQDRDSGDDTQYVTPAYSFISGGDYLFQIVGESLNGVGAEALGVPLTSDISWSLVTDAEETNGDAGMRVYRGTATATGTPTTTIDFVSTQRNCDWSLVKLTDVADIVGVTTNTGLASKNISVTIPAIGIGNGAVSFFGTDSSGTWSPGVNETALSSTTTRLSSFAQYNLLLDNVLESSYTDTSTADYLIAIGFEVELASASVDVDSTTVSVVVPSITFTSPVTSELANQWFNGIWWRAPFFGSDWWAEAVAYSLLVESTTVAVSVSEITFSGTDYQAAITVDATTVSIDFPIIDVGEPVDVDPATVTITVADMTFQVEVSSDLYVLSTVPTETFDGKGITYGTDLAYNSNTDRVYTVLSRVDTDSVLLDGIFGTPPQPFQILKHIDEITMKSVTTVEFDGTNWVVVSTTPFGL